MTNEIISAPPGNHIDIENQPIDIRHYFFLFWRWVWMFALVGVIAGAVAYYVSSRMPLVYQTQTKLLVMEAASNQPADYNSVMVSERLALTYSDMLTNEALLQEVSTLLDSRVSPAELAGMIIVEPVSDTQLMLITVEGSDPILIADIANALVKVLIERVRSIQSDRYSSSKDSLSAQLAEVEKVLKDTTDKIEKSEDPAEKQRLDAQAVQYRQIYASLLTGYEQARMAEMQTSANIVQINEARPPSSPVGPNILRNTLLVALVAMMLAVGVIFAQDILDDTVKTPEQVEKILELPVLGVIFQHTNGGQPITQEEPRSQISEAFRSLRTNVQYSNIDEPVRTLIVTSPSPMEGKSLISTNLAVVLAQSGKKVILVDSDLRRPMVHKRMNVSNAFGLTSLLLQSELVLDGVLHRTKTIGLSALTSGPLPPNPAELLGSHKMSNMLEKLKKEAEIVIFDTPPVLAVADSVVLATMVDGVLLVLRPGSTTMGAAKQAVDSLRRVNVHIMGVVLNNVNMKDSRFNKGYRYYQSSYYREDEIKPSV